MRHSQATFVAIFALLLSTTSITFGQRNTPQFSFSQPPSQFGSTAGDFLDQNGDPLSSLTGQPLQSTNSAGPQGSTFVQFSGSTPAQQSFASSLQSQFQAASNAPQAGQLLAQSLNTQQISSQQQQQRPPQPFQPFISPPSQPAEPIGQLAPQLLPSQLPPVVPSQPQQSRPQQAESQQASRSSGIQPRPSTSSPVQTSVPSTTVASIAARRQAESSSSSSRPSSTASQKFKSTQTAAQTHNQLPLAGNQASQQSQQLAIEAARRTEASQASLAAGSLNQNYQCPDSFGFYRHHKSCDKYWACENGTASLKLCGNGLMFDDSDPKRENCAYPFSVDCGSDRTDLEPPISTPNCPRLYGLFSDNANCRVFYSCWNGEASKYECPPGLAYDSEQRVCVWADLVDRCDQSEVSDGFVCPDATEVDQPGHYTRHAHPTDCRKFYVCIDGVARPYGCSFGTVFNVDSLQCDEPESVSGCEKYYGDLDPKLAKKLAKENSSGQSTSTRQSSN